MSDETIDFVSASDADPIEVELMVSHSTVNEKIEERERLNEAVEAFLASGGTISEVEPNLMADPPKKPENKYGSHPI